MAVAPKVATSFQLIWRNFSVFVHSYDRQYYVCGICQEMLRKNADSALQNSISVQWYRAAVWSQSENEHHLLKEWDGFFNCTVSLPSWLIVETQQPDDAKIARRFQGRERKREIPKMGKTRFRSCLRQKNLFGNLSWDATNTAIGTKYILWLYSRSHGLTG